MIVRHRAMLVVEFQVSKNYTLKLLIWRPFVLECHHCSCLTQSKTPSMLTVQLCCPEKRHQQHWQRLVCIPWWISTCELHTVSSRFKITTPPNFNSTKHLLALSIHPWILMQWIRHCLEGWKHFGSQHSPFSCHCLRMIGMDNASMPPSSTVTTTVIEDIVHHHIQDIPN